MDKSKAPWKIREATVTDIPMLVSLRLRFLEELDHPSIDAAEEPIRRYLEEKLPKGEFVVWLAETKEEIVAMSGLLFLEKPPTGRNLSGREGLVLNMYTLPTWRHRGIAAALLERTLSYAKEAGITWVRLHATESGRHLYEKAGFVPEDSEMVKR